MARYLVCLRSPKSPAEAFASMANLANFADRDPGVTRVEQMKREDPGQGAKYDVTAEGLRTPLRYRTTLTDDAGIGELTRFNGWRMVRTQLNYRLRAASRSASSTISTRMWSATVQPRTEPVRMVRFRRRWR